MLHPHLTESVRAKYHELQQQERLPSPHMISTYSQTFRRRFGPEALMNVDGVALLRLLCDPKDRHETLAYWLEFKNDSELPDYFGAIRSAYQSMPLGIGWSNGKGWVLRRKRRSYPVSLEEAVEAAVTYRRCLLEAARLLDSFPSEAGLDEYESLDGAIRQAMHPLYGQPWVHKYLTLLYPDKLDNYHTERWQSYHLLKLWQSTPPDLGRYHAAGYFTAIANSLGIPLTNLTYTLNQLHGRPHDWWVVETSHAEWAKGLQSGSIVHRHMPTRADWRTMNDRERKGLLSEDDIVLAAEYGHVLGIGRVTYEYSFNPDLEQHHYGVKWLSSSQWALNGVVRRPAARLDPRRYPDIWNVITAEQKAVLEADEFEVPPPHIDAIQVGRCGPLHKFRIEFPAAEHDTFGELNVSVLVGENGTGKTSLLRFISQMFNEAASETDYQVSYRIRGQSAILEALEGKAPRPGLLPAKVIVSSYSPFEQYHTKCPDGSRVPYAYVGPADDLGLTPTLLPILQATYYNDKTRVTAREEQRRNALSSLLALTGCTSPPEVEFRDEVSLNGERFMLDPFSSDKALLDHLEAASWRSATDQEAVRRLLRYWHYTVARDPSYRLSLRDFAQYPSGVPTLLADLEVAERYDIPLIKELWFSRNGALVPLLRFSSGELSLLYRFFRLLREMVDDALVIIDEPETHLHPRWILRYVRTLKEVLGGYRAHVFLATHSPFVAADLPYECIVSLREDPETKRVIARPIEDQTLGTNPLEVLHEVFGVADYIGEFAQHRIAKIRSLIDDGQFAQAQEMLQELGDSAVKFELFRRLDILQRRRRK